MILGLTDRLLDRGGDEYWHWSVAEVLDHDPDYLLQLLKRETNLALDYEARRELAASIAGQAARRDPRQRDMFR